MATDVYTLRITYQGLESKIWRDLEISGNEYLDRLGYAVLATFDTMAYHLFQFDLKGEQFQLPHDEFTDEDLDMGAFRLRQLKLSVGDTFSMEYDFGTPQTFAFTVTGIRPLEKGKGKAYPRIVAGAGWGILDDVYVDELADLINQIERNGKTDEDIYYKNRPLPWNFHPYNMKIDNCLLKHHIEMIEEGYAPFWDEFYVDDDDE